MADFQSRENRAFAYEIKALIPVERAREVRAWARARMQRDPNAESGAGDVYRITSLYYDTDGFDVFHRRGSFGRSKYRVRRYDASQRVFLERKLRNVDSCASEIGLIVHIRNWIDWAAMNAHAQLELGTALQFPADFEGAFHRRFGIVCKDEHHPIACR